MPRRRFRTPPQPILWSAKPISTRDMNILLTCAGRRVALMDAFRSALGELGLAGRVIAADATWASPAYHEADVGLVVPRADTDEYIPALLQAVREHGVALLVPATDLDLLSLARARDEFAAAGCTVMIASEPTIRACRDKAETAKLITRAGLAAIPTVALGEFLDRPFYPCFAKPVCGSASVGAAVIRDEQALGAHLATFGRDMVVQEYAPGQEFTLDVYRTRDGSVCCVVPRQRLAVRSGEVEKGVTVKDDSLIQAVVTLAEALGDLWGVFCCQCRRDGPKAQPRFFEINPRFGGGATLSIVAGANLPLYLLQEVLGREITARVGRFTEGLLMLRYDRATFVQTDPADLDKLPGYDAPSFR